MERIVYSSGDEVVKTFEDYYNEGKKAYERSDHQTCVDQLQVKLVVFLKITKKHNVL